MIKMRYGFLLMCMFVAGCRTTEQKPVSIIGVWELTEMRMSRLSQLPSIALANKKEIYTGNGLYYDSAAESTHVTDTRPRRYVFKNNVVTLFSADGQKTIQSKAHFVSPSVMELLTPEGDVVVFNRVSDDPNRIPCLPRRAIPVRIIKSP